MGIESDWLRGNPKLVHSIDSENLAYRFDMRPIDLTRMRTEIADLYKRVQAIEEKSNGN